ncbi:hypothetical protein HYH02_006120 [Chlamydomonas schloesseri]|uniref:Uncharacterized protein n=1 Tax=Chlamydomonas schloesseri TaxID=2026947 RepID=A0A835WJW1_9CHLO|nr:hypothetical protein HYH02_006120 [Chlamydomonas schloesseri]|eukprot:KAG2448766.1 hypothetical protein HYH02_006120 [Chlamydomonas schloesseri]
MLEFAEPSALVRLCQVGLAAMTGVTRKLTVAFWKLGTFPVVWLKGEYWGQPVKYCKAVQWHGRERQQAGKGPGAFRGSEAEAGCVLVLQWQSQGGRSLAAALLPVRLTIL